MRLALLLVAGCNTALAWHPGSSSSAAAPDSGDAWKRFTLKDVALGGDLFKTAGFTCGPDPAMRGFSTYRRTCVRFLDERCTERPHKIWHTSNQDDYPKGQTCFMDEDGQQTYLDGKYMSPPLQAIAIVGTDTESHRIYEIDYTFARDVLAADSRLGKALIDKYGPPTTTNGEQMDWEAGKVHMTASCAASCQIRISDDGLLAAEREKQKAHDDAKAKHDAPAPPSF